MSDLEDPSITFLDGSIAPPNAIAVPCGLMAKYVFNDTFKLYKKNDDGTKTFIDIDSNNIAWLSDVQVKFNNTDMKTVPDSYKEFIKNNNGKGEEITSFE